MFPENRETPQIIHFHEVFDIINHPKRGTPIFGNIHILGPIYSKILLQIHMNSWSVLVFFFVLIPFFRGGAISNLAGCWSSSCKSFRKCGLWSCKSCLVGSWSSTSSWLACGANGDAYCGGKSTWTEWKGRENHQNQWRRAGCCIAKECWTLLGDKTDSLLKKNFGR